MFFALSDELPDDVGFSLFGPVHIAWLAGITAAIVVALRLLRGRTRAQTVASWVTMVLAIFLVVLLEAFFWVKGVLDADHLPLELCLMAPFLYLIHALTGWDWAGQTSYCLCLPGAAAALLFSNWTAYPQFSFINLQSFALHALLVFYPLLSVRRRTIVPRVSHVWKAWAFLLCVVPPICAFDKHVNVNYFFLNWGSPGSPLDLLIAWMGNPGFLAGFALLMGAVMLAMYLPYSHPRAALREWRNKRR